MAKTKKTTKKKVKKNVPIGEAYIQSSFNNTIITITDPQGNVVSWSSGGVVGFVISPDWDEVELARQIG